MVQLLRRWQGVTAQPGLGERQIEQRIAVVLVSGSLEPVLRQGWVSRQALAQGHGEVELAQSQALAGRLLKPLGGLCRVCWPALALQTHQPEVELGQRVALLGGLLVILPGLRLVWLQAFAGLVQAT